MFFRLFEGWHLVLLLIVILVLFGGKRLPDAARGLGRSLRIFKSEMKGMQDDDHHPTNPTPATPPEPLEGRVVQGDPGRTTTPSEHQHDL
jgi:sec-independent protein translocase protein TatA